MSPSTTAAPVTHAAPTRPPLRGSVASCLNPFPFRPTTEAASDVLSAYIDPDQTLSDIAQRFQTSVIALAEWLNTPEVEAQLEALERAAARRTRFIAVANQRIALGALISILEGHEYDEQHVPVDSQNLKAVTQRDRRRAAARLAASQLLRLAAKAPLSPAPGGVWGGDVTSAASDRGGAPTTGRHDQAESSPLDHGDAHVDPEGRISTGPNHGLKPTPPATIARRSGEEQIADLETRAAPAVSQNGDSFVEGAGGGAWAGERSARCPLRVHRCAMNIPPPSGEDQATPKNETSPLIGEKQDDHARSAHRLRPSGRCP